MHGIRLAGAILAVGVSAALAQPVSAPVKNPSLAMTHQGMHGGAHESHAAGDRLPSGHQSPPSLAFQGANEKMHREMAIAFTGDADVDFVRAMIPHHQGAIDMAKIVLAFGKDPEIRQLAEAIVAAQEKEIAEMRAWLERKSQ